MIVAGVMSGTSCDGADAVALDLQSAAEPHEPRVVAHAFEPYSSELRALLLRPEELRVQEITELHASLPEIYARAVLALGCAVELAGMHGQTLWHAPPSKKPRVASTLQIGSTAILAHRLGVPVVGDLRGADIAEGGEGAPIVPFAHWFFTPQASRPRMVVNIGGIANVTLVRGGEGDVMGFDIGPGMMIADALARRLSDGALDCDADGVLSRDGHVVAAITERIQGHPFVAAPPPKSTGREEFGAGFYEPLFEDFAVTPSADAMASVLHATAAIIAAVAREHGFASSEILLTGGGAKNPTLHRFARELLPEARVRAADSGVFAPAHHEPAAVALIAARTFARLPSSLPKVTGAARSAVLGHVHWP